MTVYVVQNHRRYNRDTGEYESAFDLSPAEEYGELSYLLSPTAAPWNPDSVIPELWDNLQYFNDNDHLLLIGNPMLIGWATAIATSANNGRVSLLQWHGRERRYIPVEAQLFEVDADVDSAYFQTLKKDNTNE